MKKFRILACIPIILLLLAGVLFYDRLTAPRISGTIDSPLIGKKMPIMPITLPKGPFILNFFASWCAPCIIEAPHLMRLKEQGVTIIGITVRDAPEDTALFLKRHGNPYATIFNANDETAALSMGITGVPESFAVDATGTIRARIQGPLEDPRVIASFLEFLGGTPK